jgi:hypothetical protein
MESDALKYESQVKVFKYFMRELIYLTLTWCLFTAEKETVSW